MLAEIIERLEREGFVHLAGCVTDASFVTMATRLGTVVDDTAVKVVPGKQTYLARPQAIPLHTDHPSADVVAWRCERQDLADGASLLVDGRAVAASLDLAVVDQLRLLRLPAVVRAGGGATATPILSPDSGQMRVFFAPWLEPIEKHSGGLDALGELRSALVRHSPVRVRLKAGEILLVDNHRVLHGRGPIRADSPRRLRRLWIRRGA